MAISSKRAYATSRSQHPKPLPMWLTTADSYLPRRHSNTWRQVWLISLGSPGVHKVLSEPSEHLWQISGLILNVISRPPTVFLGLLLCPSMWGILFWWDPTFSYCWLFSSEFSQEKMRAHPSTPPSCWVSSCFSRVWFYDPVNCIPPASSVHGLFQARIPEWVPMPFSRGQSY